MIKNQILCITSIFFLLLSFNFSNAEQMKKQETIIENLDRSADPSVPEELGGNGFKEIAKDLGYITYNFTEEDLYFKSEETSVL